MRAAGRYFDGEQSRPFSLEVEAQHEGLLLIHPDLPSGRVLWRYAHLREQGDGAGPGRMTLALREHEARDSALLGLERLVLSDPVMIARVRRESPNLARRDVARGSLWKVTSRIGLAIGALCLILFVILPQLAATLAGIIPIEREVRWGKAVVAQVERVFGGKSPGALVCRNEAGNAALGAMVERLSRASEVEYELDVRVFDHPMVNAFAAPGGQIVIMRGLIDAAETPEEVAAVLAHEIGHVENRDPTRASLRAAGSAGLLALVLGDFTGGTIAVVVAEVALTASYTRKAESRADRYAHEMLDAAGVSAKSMAAFFEKLKAQDRKFDMPAYLASHPALELRADEARRFSDTQGETQPVLTPEEWEALRKVCS